MPVLEKDDSVGSNVVQEETKVEETVEGTKETVETTEGEATQETETSTETTEQTVELDGQQIPLSQLKEALEVHKNQKEWNQKNTQKAQELAEQKRQLQEAELIASQVRQRPDLLQALITPKAERNFEVELQNLYAQRPDPSSPEYSQWEFTKDQLNSERLQANIQRQNDERFSRTASMQHNDTIEASARQEYVGKKVTAEEFRDMGDWVVSNIRPDASGKFPKSCFDTAYRQLFFDKAVTEAKLEATKSVGKSILSAKPASSAPGATKRAEAQTQEEQDEQEFIALARLHK